MNRINKKNNKNSRNNNKRKPTPRSEKLVISRFALRADRMLHKILQSEAISLAYTPSTGWGGAGPDLTIAVAQQGILYSSAGSTWNVVNFNNYASLAAVFQEYRLREFSVEVFFSENTFTTPSAGTSGTLSPMLFSVIDREDAVGVTSATQALQYPSCHVTQLGINQGPKTTTIVGPSAASAYDNDATFVGTLSAAGVVRSPWLACGSNSGANTAPVIPHGYVKYYAGSSSSFATQSGVATFIVRCAFEYRGID
jgi:hypothetical protein